MKNLLNIKTILELVLLVHGIGMLGGVYIVATKESWFSKLLNPRLAAIIGSVFWVFAGIALIAAAWALFKDLGWFRTAATTAFIANTIAISLWYGSVPGGAVFGAVASDIALIYLLLK